ncbi:MAG: mechanosensitive ion channel family protein [Candidatus Limnocylindria bacterium]
MPVDAETLRATAIDYGVRTLWAAAVAVIAVAVARAIRATTIGTLGRRRASPNATVLLGNLAQLGILLLGALVVLAIYTQGAFGWILTSFSVLGIVIGLSLQDILKNFFAGIWILVEHPFRIGDTIEISGYGGAVEEISFRTTQLRTPDGREVIVPNGDLMTKPVVNLSRFPARRGSLVLELPPGHARDGIDRSVRDALASVPAIAADPSPSVELSAVTTGIARYVVSFWAADLESALAAGLAAVGARFPEAEVHGA